MKKEIISIKGSIRELGDVNVNAIEAYKELMERYEFMRTQRDDIVEAKESLEKVIAELSKRENYWIFLMGGGKAEKIALRPIARKSPHVISMAEIKHRFIDEYALFAKCDLMLTMESANMHLASLTGIPVVSIWGATHPFAGFMGWNQTKDNAVQADLDCRPCSIFGQKPCKRGDYACMTMIKPETVVEKVNTLLQTKQNN
jgi:ADP-heptose:LPS heptosyltransferase